MHYAFSIEILGIFMKKMFAPIAAIILCGSLQPSLADDICKEYPHWDCNDPQLALIDNVVKSHLDSTGRGHGIAAFDWDGTLYEEHIPNPDLTGDFRSGQSIWHIWAADHIASYPYLFPAFKTSDNHAENIKTQDSYLEGKFKQVTGPGSSNPLSPTAYDKFSQIGTMENGMSLQELQDGIHGYVKDFSPKTYAFTKVLDIVQRFQNKGYVVWIITGSNPYVLANIINDTDGVNSASLNYNLLPGCKNAADNYPQFLKTCTIAGNSAKVDAKTKRFTSVYDNRFLSTQLNAGEMSIVDGYGKQLVLQQLRDQSNLPIVLYAGNSNGDTFAMQNTLDKQPDAMGVFVQPTRSKSTDFLNIFYSASCTGRCIDIENTN